MMILFIYSIEKRFGINIENHLWQDMWPWNFSYILDHKSNYLESRSLTMFENKNWANSRSKQFLNKLILKHFIQPLFSMEDKHLWWIWKGIFPFLLLMKLNWHSLERESSVKMGFVVFRIGIIQGSRGCSWISLLLDFPENEGKLLCE